MTSMLGLHKGTRKQIRRLFVKSILRAFGIAKPEHLAVIRFKTA